MSESTPASAPAHRPVRRPRRWLVPLALTTVAIGALVGAGRLYDRSTDPDDPLFHPRFRLRVVDDATGAPVARAQVFALRGEGGRAEPVPIWPHAPRVSPFPNPFVNERVAFTDERGEVEIAADAAYAGCTVHVGARPALLGSFLPEPAAAARPPEPDAPRFAYTPTLDGVAYDDVRVQVVRNAPSEIRLHKTPLGTVSVREGSADGPPIAGARVLSGRCGDATARRPVEGVTDESGRLRIPLPVSGSLRVFFLERGEPDDRCAPERLGRLDRAHPEVVLFAPPWKPRPRIRLLALEPVAGTLFTAYARRAGRRGEFATTRGVDEVHVEPEDPDGLFDLYVDGGDAGGRAILRGVACPSTTGFRAVRGARIRVSLVGVRAERAYAARADSLDWPGRSVLGTRAGASTLVLSSLPAGRWRVVVARAENDDVWRRELEVEVGDDVVERTVDVSSD